MSEKQEQEIQVVQPIASIELLKKSFQDFEKLKAELLTDDDWQQIGEKRHIRRSGFRKIALAFGLSDVIVEQARTDRPDETFTWRIRARAFAKNGRSAEGVGACDSRERNFAHLEHDVYATAHTRAKSRAISDLVAGGAVSAEEVEAERGPAQVDVQRQPVGPPSKAFAFEKPPISTSTRMCSPNQRFSITIASRKASAIVNYDVLESVLLKYGAAQLEQLTFDEAEDAIKMIDALLAGRA